MNGEGKEGHWFSLSPWGMERRKEVKNLRDHILGCILKDEQELHWCIMKDKYSGKQSDVQNILYLGYSLVCLRIKHMTLMCQSGSYQDTETTQYIGQKKFT